MLGRAQLGLAIVNPQIERARGAAMQYDGVEAGELQLGRPETAGLGIAGPAGDRRFGHSGAAALLCVGEAAGSAQYTRPRILGPERVGAAGRSSAQLV